MTSKFFGIAAALLILWAYIGAAWLDEPKSTQPKTYACGNAEQKPDSNCVPRKPLNGAKVKP